MDDSIELKEQLDRIEQLLEEQSILQKRVLNLKEAVTFLGLRKQTMGRIIILISIYLFLTSCNKIFYGSPMQKESEIVDDIPDSFLGEYLEIYFEEYGVAGKFKTIGKT